MELGAFSISLAVKDLGANLTNAILAGYIVAHAHLVNCGAGEVRPLANHRR